MSIKKNNIVENLFRIGVQKYTKKITPTIIIYCDFFVSLQSVMEIQLDDISIVAEYRRVRNMRLTVYRSGKVMLVLPYLTPMHEAMRFVEQKADWIRKHHKNRFQPSKKEPFHYTDGERHLLFGDSLILQVKQISSGHQTVTKQEDRLVMLCKYDTDESHREALLYSFYRRELNRYLEQRLAYYTLII